MLSNSSQTSLLSSRPLSNTELDKQLFVDRTREVEALRTAIDNKYNILLAGPTGIGKTTLVYRLLLSKETSRSFIFCSMSPLISDSVSMIDALAISLAQHVQKLAPKRITQRMQEAFNALSVSRMNFSLLGAEVSLAQQQNQGLVEAKYASIVKLAEAISAISDGNLTITFILDSLPNESELYMEFFGQYRDILWRMSCNFLVVCDQAILYEIWKPPLSSFFDTKIQVQPLSKESAKMMLMVRDFDPGYFFEAMYWLSGGVPRRLLNLARKISLGLITMEKVEAVASNRMRIEQTLSPTEQEVIMEIEEFEEGVSASNESLQKCMNLSRGRLAQIFIKLTTMKILQSDKVGRERLYRLANELSLEQDRE